MPSVENNLPLFFDELRRECGVSYQEFCRGKGPNVLLRMNHNELDPIEAVTIRQGFKTAKFISLRNDKDIEVIKSMIIDERLCNVEHVPMKSPALLGFDKDQVVIYDALFPQGSIGTPSPK